MGVTNSEMIHGSISHCYVYIFIYIFSLVNKIHICIYFCLFSFILSAFLSSSPKSLFPFAIACSHACNSVGSLWGLSLNPFTSLFFPDQDTSRDYSYPDVGRRTPQSRRQTPDVREVGNMHHSCKILVASLIFYLSFDQTTNKPTSWQHVIKFNFSASFTRQKLPARAIYDFKAQTAK